MWVSIFEGAITDDWQYTSIVKTTQLRIRYLSSPEHKFYSRLLLQRKIIVNGNEEFYYAGQAINSKDDQVISLRSQPSMFRESVIGVRRNKKFLYNWHIGVDYWSDPNEFTQAIIKTLDFNNVLLNNPTVEIPFPHWIVEHKLNTLNPAIEFFDEFNKPQMVDFLPIDGERIAISSVDVTINQNWKLTVIGKGEVL
jgi:hypothetical protein